VPIHAPLHLPHDPSPFDSDVKFQVEAEQSTLSAALWPELKLCIIGAGAAGLYIAMILDSLNIPYLTYDILESSERTGGRIFTHYFDPPTKHMYYDIGAMRFPKVAAMDR
jgi:hypothetical protein